MFTLLEAVSTIGERYIRYLRCDRCLGSGNQTKWIAIQERAKPN